MGYWAGKVALVTGAASGVGRATALRFLAEGAAAALLDRDGPGLRRTAEGAETSSVLVLPVDLREEEAVDQAVDRAAGWKGRLDAVANCAAICPPEEFTTSTREEWEAIVDVNLRGYYLVARRAARSMERAGGAIVNVSSILGLVGEPACVAYGATKGGILAMTRAMAMRLAPRVRVNAVSPGSIATPQTLDWLAKLPDPNGARAKLEALYPLGRIAEPEDIAGAILFLCGPDARWITGANLVVDGGLTAMCPESALWAGLGAP
jgi:NAD(P)-dependent dehydrogenase (short-subunit alcohol dehydrogenase family)